MIPSNVKEKTILSFGRASPNPYDHSSLSKARDILAFLRKTSQWYNRVLLPMKKHTVESLIEQILWIQERNHRAYLSHRRKRIKNLAHYSQVSL